MLRILAAFHLDDPASLKRAITTAIGGVVVLGLNPFLRSRGLPEVSDTALELFAGLLAGFVLQSGASSAMVRKVEAVTVANAAALAQLDQPLASASPSTVLSP